MKQKNTYTLREAIEDLIKAYGYEDKLLETSLIASWEKVVRGVYAAHTKHLKVKNRILFVHIDTPALRQELIMQKSELMEKLNAQVGKKVIDDIVFR